MNDEAEKSLDLNEDEVDTLREACLITQFSLAAWMMAINFRQVSPQPSDVDENGHLRPQVTPVNYGQLLDECSITKRVKQKDFYLARYALNTACSFVTEQEKYNKYQFFATFRQRALDVLTKIEIFQGLDLLERMEDHDSSTSSGDEARAE